ncbi:hypothetical protein GQ457_02G040590 [Hibiscus cannabinus]
MSSLPNSDIVGRWGESLDDFSEDEENIVPIAEDDDVHLLDVDDIEAVMADANEGNGLHVEDDVWNAAVARLGSGNTQPVWGYVGPQTENPVLNYTAYEPPTRMYDVDYTAMRDREHEARVFGCSSSSNYGELVLNAQFESKKEAQLAVKEYCIKRHMRSCVVESNTQTYCVRCVNFSSNCPWWVRISYKRRSQMWEVTRFKENHTCSNMALSQDHINLDSDLICAYTKLLVEKEPRISIAVLVASIRNQFGYIPSYYKAWTAKQKAMAQVYGDWDRSYNELPALLRAMQIFIPGTKVEYETKPALNLQGDVIHGKRVFKKLFWAFNACIEGFPFCKRMIQVDGTWLYGKYGHILLLAVAQDGDSNIFPIAFAIVEKEDADGWEFFLNNLRNHVVKDDGICMISDRGTALLSIIDKDGSLWKPPHAYPAYCVRHIAANAKTRFGNNQIRKDILGAGKLLFIVY